MYFVGTCNSHIKKGFTCIQNIAKHFCPKKKIHGVKTVNITSTRNVTVPPAICLARDGRRVSSRLHPGAALVRYHVTVTVRRPKDAHHVDDVTKNGLPAID